MNQNNLQSTIFNDSDMNTVFFRPPLLFTRIQIHAVGWILHNCFALFLHATKQILVCRKSIMKFILKATLSIVLFYVIINIQKNSDLYQIL